MFRVLLVILIIANVVACPYNCATKASAGAPSKAVTKGGCTCCHRPAKAPERSAPTNRDSNDDCCPCFCNCSIISTSAHAKIDFELANTLCTPCVAASASHTQLRGFSAVHDSAESVWCDSGLGLRVAICSFLL